MSLRDLAKTLAKAALPIAGDIAVPCLVQHGDEEPFYDTTTGEVLDTAAAESQVSLILSPVGKADRSNTDKQAAPIGDLEALALDVSQFKMKPARGDVVQKVGDVDQYVVVDVTTDEAEATFTLILIRIGGGTSNDA